MQKVNHIKKIFADIFILFITEIFMFNSLLSFKTKAETCTSYRFIESMALKQEENSNWCLNTCLNLVYRDYLAKKGESQPANTDLGREPSNEKFAELAFVYQPAYQGFNIKNEEEQKRYIKEFFTTQPFNDEFALQMFNSYLKDTTPKQRYDIWEGVKSVAEEEMAGTNWLTDIKHPKAELKAMPESIKKRFPTTLNAVNKICEAINLEGFTAELLKVSDDLGMDKNPWEEIAKEITLNKRPVILYTFQAGIRIGHAVLAYKVEEEEEPESHEKKATIHIYDPYGTTTTVEVDTQFNPMFRVQRIPVYLSSYFKFAY